ncbi:MAG: alpha/beta hydrolase family protein, partial [Steroidobacteraceae bacterium]
MFKLLKLSAFALGAAYLAACGGSSSQTGAASTSTSRGTLSVTPPFRIASLNAAAFQGELAASPTGAQLLELTGNPMCGVDFYYIRFWTVGGAGETTESSGALMVPTGAAPACSGPRPIVEYAHGTNPNKALNIADITNASNTEGVLIAAMFAAQGYIVVAPNYAGYDISTLGYHPFLNAVQQSGEMMDILAAARTALPTTLSSATSDDGQLFLTGYSE